MKLSLFNDVSALVVRWTANAVSVRNAPIQISLLMQPTRRVSGCNFVGLDCATSSFELASEARDCQMCLAYHVEKSIIVHRVSLV